MFAQLIDEVTTACEEELGDLADITDGTAVVEDCTGFFRREFSETLSESYGITQADNTWECKVSALAGLDLDGVGSSLKVTFERIYVVMDIRYDTFGNCLLVLSR